MLAGRRMWKGLSDGAIIRRLASSDIPSLPADALHVDPGYIPVEQPIAATGAMIVNLTLERESK